MSTVAAASSRERIAADAPLAIQVEDVRKAFRIPTQRVDSLKERAVHPFAAREYRELNALAGVSFEIRQGEFFGIVGRNGSGKSTLLKLLASIYRADSGRIRIAGRLAPFIELGVGFNQELTARENVVLNGVMMGLTPGEMRRRFDAVIEFAELREFADLKLKNYSSGMLVRLAFAVMMEAEADVLLIDEVLAVGDASFQQKCADAFHQMKAEGRTIVLVTHEMAAVETYCDRAMLLQDGKIAHCGAPDEVGREYLRLNFADDAGADDVSEPNAEEAVASGGAGIDSCELLDADGSEASTFELGQLIRLRLELDLQKAVPGLHVGLIVVNADGIALFEIGVPVYSEDGKELGGDAVTVEVEIENRLGVGRHFVNCALQSPFGISIYEPEVATFVVFGTQANHGMIAPAYEAGFTVSKRSER